MLLSKQSKSVGGQYLANRSMGVRRLEWERQNTYKKGKSQDLSNYGLELVVHKTSVLGAREE